jgi:hypothetical protein
MLDNFGGGGRVEPPQVRLKLMSNLTNPWGCPPLLGFQIYSYYDINNIIFSTMMY